MSEHPTGQGAVGTATTPTGRLGMRLLLAALAMLFAASIVGYLVVRLRAPSWPPAGMPRLPASLWVSTVLILASSASIELACRGARRGQAGTTRRGLALTLLLGGAFLGNQTVGWFALVAARLTATANLYGFTFFMLTGLHAAHVLGGIAPLAFVTARAWRADTAAVPRAGVEYTAMYWHFLTAVWLVMYAVLLVAS
jgi:cytochrome c oxidase subunit III